jgi:hypothetical protein
MAVRLYFFHAIELSEYRIGEFKKLSDYWISEQGLNLSANGYRTQKRVEQSRTVILSTILIFFSIPKTLTGSLRSLYISEYSGQVNLRATLINITHLLQIVHNVLTV